VTSLLHRTPPAGSAPTGFDRRLVLPLMLGSILNPINSSMIAVTLVPIGIAFGAPPAQTVWLVSALYLATAVGQPVVGRLVDLYGPRRLYLAGTSLVGIAGVIGALAPSLPVLVASRVLLGLGTCSAFPAAMYLIRSEARRTGKESPAGVLTALSVTNQTIAIVGPTLGGLLVGLGGWRTIFTVNIPLSIACLVLGSIRLPRTTALDDAKPSRGGLRDIDAAGMVLFAATLGAFMTVLMTPRWWWLALVTVVLGAAFAHRELRATAPFLDLRVLATSRPLLATYGRQWLGSIVSYAFLYGYTQWLEGTRGFAASTTGLLLLPMSATSVVVATFSGRRPQIRGKLVVGALGLVAACALVLTLGDTSAVWLLVGVAVLAGVPQGLLSLANQNATYHQADPDRMGSAAGLLRTFLYLGAIVASAAVAAAFPHGTTSSGLHGLGWFLVGCAVALLVLVLSDRSLRLVGARPVPR
jgi:MFS family permease